MGTEPRQGEWPAAIAVAAPPARRRDLRVAALVTFGLAAVMVSVLQTPAAPERSYAVAGTYCDSCPDPVIHTFGVEFRHNELWTLAADGTVTRLDACQPAQVFSVQGFRGMATGLGWDSRRDQFIVIDALLDSVMVVDMRGTVLRVFPSPGSGPVGAAYDTTRDAIWITDFETDSLYAIAATNGARIAAFRLPAGVRVAGAAYDRSLDAIIYQARVLDAMGHIASCTTGALLGSFPLPYTGINGWEDNAIAPNGALWIHDFEEEKIYCINRATTATHLSSWGGLKLRYRNR